MEAGRIDWTQVEVGEAPALPAPPTRWADDRVPARFRRGCWSLSLGTNRGDGMLQIIGGVVLFAAVVMCAAMMLTRTAGQERPTPTNRGDRRAGTSSVAHEHGGPGHPVCSTRLGRGGGGGRAGGRRIGGGGRGRCFRAHLYDETCPAAGLGAHAAVAVGRGRSGGWAGRPSTAAAS